jgi:hypothetical protein
MLITPAIMDYIRELVNDFNAFIALHWGQKHQVYQLALNASNT